MSASKLKKNKFLSNRANKQQSVTDEDVEIFKRGNNLKTDREAISFLINKLSISGGGK